MESEQTALVERTVKGTAWNYATFILGKLVTFAATTILARLLAPEDFGLMSLGLIAINYLDTFGELGVGSAVIFRRENDKDNANVAFTMAMLVNIILAAIAFLVAPAVAAFFKEPRVIPVVQVLAVTFIFSGLGRIHEALLKKDLKFRKTVIPQIAKTTVKAVVSIGLALMGYGVWSLVWGQVAASLVVSVFYWWALRWRPRLSLNLTIVHRLLSYSSHIVLAEILGMIQNNLDYLIIGRLLGSIPLGYYTMAFRIPELVIINLCYVVSMALFPAYARLQDQLDKLKRGFLSTLKYVAMITVPIGIGLTIITPEFIEVFFSDRWQPAVPAMQALSLYALVYSLSFNSGDVYKAIGRPDVLNKLSIVKLGVTIPALWIAASYSIYHVAWAQLGANILLTFIRLDVARRLLSLDWRRIASSLKPGFAGALVMGLAVYFLRLGMLGLSPLVRLFVLPAVGLLVYVAVIRLAYPEALQQAIDLASSLFARKSNLSEVQR